jgi:uncharacterized protein (TIGR00251 family)
MTRASVATTIQVKAVPRAARDEIVGWLGGALKVRVTAPPQDGRANAALEALIAAALGVARGAVRVAAGHGSARKRVEIVGLDRAEIERRLSGAARVVASAGAPD